MVAFGQAGKCPTGTDFFAAMLVLNQSIRFYTYYPGMALEPDGVTCWGRFGDGSETYESSPLSADVWHHIEFAVKLNTPGQADASQTFWVDGVRRGRWSGFRLRVSEVLRLNAVQLTFSRTITQGQPRSTWTWIISLRTGKTLSRSCCSFRDSLRPSDSRPRVRDGLR
jgi:hypothetical protein